MDKTPKSMTLNLSGREMEALEQLCTKKGLSKTALIRQCIRLYQAVDHRLQSGERLYFEDDKKKEKSELVIL